jgi:membrane-bound lytic murein transglycosylase D
MKILRALLTPCFIGLICFSLSACSSHNKKSSLPEPSPQITATDSEDEEIASAEPEETAAEELEALNKPGAWEYGINQTYSLEKLGIDPSRYDFPITVNKQVLYYLQLFQGKQRKSFSIWLARSAMYRPYIEAELKKAGLPLDLVYLAMIESGFNPSAYSPANACGLWQFIEGTGTRFGLRIDPWVDERRQPDKATKAATRYLSRLYSQFDDWYLAVAAYNAGEGKIDTAMKSFKAKDFWEVASSEGIFMETKRYVPKLIAAIIIARDPEKYGFTDIAYKKPLEYDTIDIPGGVNLDAVALTAKTSVKELRALNNELRKNQTPPKQKVYALRIPVGCKELVASNLNKLRPVTTTSFATHTVKKGETLSAICALYNINKTTLLKANNLKSARLSQGLRLKIPSTSTQYILPKEGQPAVHLAKAPKTGKQRQAVMHTLKAGESLSLIAKKYNVPVKNILEWNKISNPDTVKQNQTIALLLDRPAPVKDALTVKPVNAATEKHTAFQVPTLEATKKRNVVTARPEASPKQPVATVNKEKERLPTWYIVKNGDTLTAIARKFQASAQEIREWNKLSDNFLRTGNKLIVRKG